jgi:hypothetical protein
MTLTLRGCGPAGDLVAGPPGPPLDRVCSGCEQTPERVDVLFDNLGGEVLEERIRSAPPRS